MADTTTAIEEIFPLFFDIAWRLGCNMNGKRSAVAEVPLGLGNGGCTCTIQNFNAGFDTLEPVCSTYRSRSDIDMIVLVLRKM